MSRNSRSESPSWFVFVDTETRNVPIDENKVEAKLFLGYACFVRRYKQRNKQYETVDYLRFTESEEFISWVLSKIKKRTKVYVFAHNMQFDFQVLGIHKYMTEKGFKPLVVIIDSPPFIVSYRKDNTTIVFMDSMNYFRTSLKKLGESIGFKKLDMPDEKDPVEKWEDYCRQDVDVLRIAILSFIDFVKGNDLGNFQRTLASQAFTAYRHRFMDVPIYIHDEEDALEMERLAYYGGRTECFKIGALYEKMYLLDVNSMYPAVMRDYEYPFKYYGHAENLDLNKLQEVLEVFSAIAEVDVETEDPVYPLRFEDKLIFPVGKFKTYLTTPELKYALENNHIKKIRRLYAYRKGKIFTRFVDELYSLRLKYKQEGNEAYAYMLKILMNSLYGKFGQNGRKWKTVMASEDEEFEEWIEVNVDTGEKCKFRKALNLIQFLDTEEESFNSFPAIAAHVTAYARMMLWRYIQIAGRKNVYYCDTDSLLVNEIGYRNLKEYIDVDKLGYLKLEDTIDYAEIYAPKDYVFGKKIKRKGIRNTAIELGKCIFEQDKFWGIKTALRNGLYDRQIIEKQIKILNRKYEKGEVTEDNEVIPLRFPQ